MMKRLIALLLATLLLLSLAACGRRTKDQETESVEVEFDDDYQGEMPIVKPGDEPVTIKIGIHRLANVESYEDNVFTNWLEEQTGINIEFMLFSGSTADAAKQVSLMITSGEELPDILHPGGISKELADDYGAEGYFLDLKPYFEHYAYYHTRSFDMFEDKNVYKRAMALAEEPTTGALYNFPFVSHSPLDHPNCHAWINQEWLDKLGLKMPRTLDELHEVLIAFRDKDPNGNGKKDEIPMIGKAETAHVDILRPLINAYIYWLPAYHFNVTNGKLWTPYDQDEYRQALIYINGLVKEGLLSELTWTQSSEELKGLFNPADGVYRCGVITGNANLTFLPDSPSVYAYEPLPPFKAETKKGGYGPIFDVNMRFNTFISATCKHSVEAFKLLDFMSSPEAILIGRWGKKGVNWDYSEGGKLGNLGGEAKIKLLTEPVFSTQNNANWHSTWSVFSEEDCEYEVEEDGWDAARIKKYLKNRQNYDEAGQPDEIVTYLNYDHETFERRTEIAKELTTYVKDRRAQFCTGIQDPNSDAAWQEYLDGLDALCYDEWLGMAQTAYEKLQEEINSWG